MASMEEERPAAGSAGSGAAAPEAPAGVAYAGDVKFAREDVLSGGAAEATRLEGRLRVLLGWTSHPPPVADSLLAALTTTPIRTATLGSTRRC